MPVDVEARIITVRNAIVAEIDAEIAAKESSGTAITPARFTTGKDYVDDYQLANMKHVRVNIKIVGDETEALDRKPSSEDLYRFEISIQQACHASDTAKLDALFNLAKRIGKLYYPNRRLALENPVTVTVNETELYNYVCLRDHKHFHSRINLTLREYVDD